MSNSDLGSIIVDARNKIRTVLDKTCADDCTAAR